MMVNSDFLIEQRISLCTVSVRILKLQLFSLYFVIFHQFLSVQELRVPTELNLEFQIYTCILQLFSVNNLYLCLFVCVILMYYLLFQVENEKKKPKGRPKLGLSQWLSSKEKTRKK